jgi:uncharacterized protein YcfJ
MKTIVLAAAGACALWGFAGSASAQVYGDTARVISATPIHDRVAAPRRDCRMEQAGAEGNVQRCDTIADAREVVVGYDVRYEYNGREFRARLDYDPGPQLPVNVEVRPPQERAPASRPRAPIYRGTY